MTEPLTRDEATVLRLIANGLDQPTIALRLNVKPSAVHEAVRGLRRKLNATTLASVVHQAHRAGLLRAD